MENILKEKSFLVLVQISLFIRMAKYICHKKNLWDAPKYLIGESYEVQGSWDFLWHYKINSGCI